MPSSPPRRRSCSPGDEGSGDAGVLEPDSDVEALEFAEAASTTSDGPADGDGSMVGTSDGARVATAVGFNTELNVASMTVAAVRVKVQVSDLPEHVPPDQPPKTEPAAAEAVSVTGWPEAKATWHAPPHEMPRGLLLTDPEPLPFLATVTVDGSTSLNPWSESVPPPVTMVFVVKAFGKQPARIQHASLPAAGVSSQNSVLRGLGATSKVAVQVPESIPPLRRQSICPVGTPPSVADWNLPEPLPNSAIVSLTQV
jgi:hypothetical protein